ncbi:SDR family oxidoreductase [uncultured Erythrobacter sp.]|uniref:SDR family NAD(P)-dependent oxidoreductase n=1 Tax=uncultured Erythrobacter sp. TaxID=263913 RepID=UPI002622F6D8|nr:SDR family oxidoreductase [uncultured Erythrobacter sp.]
MSDIKDFQGRIALVTGAASGIGAACAKLLDARGAAKLFLVDVDAAGLEALDLSCQVEHVVGSVADEALWASLEPRLAGLDHAIANAGIASGGSLTEISFADWRRVLDVNLDGAYLTLAAAMRAMEAGGKGGSAVITSSSTAVKAVPGIGPYGVSKAAVAHMARIAALEGAPKNIRVNAIAPGGVDTNIWDSSEAFRDAAAKHGRDVAIKGMAAGTPNGRFASSEEIAGTILYMLSDAGSNMTGHVLVSDGGFTL